MRHLPLRPLSLLVAREETRRLHLWLKELGQSPPQVVPLRTKVPGLVRLGELVTTKDALRPARPPRRE